jgi:hypothetical protein
MGIYPTTTVLNEGQLPGEFLVSEAPGHRSRETRFLEAGQNLIGGTILGLLTAVAGVQVLTITGSPSSGTFTVTDFNGESTAPLAYNVSTANLATALNALPEIAALGGVAVTGTAGTTYTVTSNNSGVEFTLTVAGALPQAVATANVGANAQTITMIGAPTGGTFTITDDNGETTTALAYNASTATVAAALNALPAIIALGGVGVTGTAGTSYVVTATTETSVIEITVQPSLTGTVTAVSISTTDTGGSITVGALNLSNSDGSQTATDILWANTNATTGVQECVTVARDAEVNQAEIFYPTGATASQIASINLALLNNSGIVVRPAV